MITCPLLVSALAPAPASGGSQGIWLQPCLPPTPATYTGASNLTSLNLTFLLCKMGGTDDGPDLSGHVPNPGTRRQHTLNAKEAFCAVSAPLGLLVERQSTPGWGLPEGCKRLPYVWLEPPPPSRLSPRREGIPARNRVAGALIWRGLSL